MTTKKACDDVCVHSLELLVKLASITYPDESVSVGTLSTPHLHRRASSSDHAKATGDLAVLIQGTRQFNPLRSDYDSMHVMLAFNLWVKVDPADSRFYLAGKHDGGVASRSNDYKVAIVKAACNICNKV